MHLYDINLYWLLYSVLNCCYFSKVLISCMILGAIQRSNLVETDVHWLMPDSNVLKQGKFLLTEGSLHDGFGESGGDGKTGLF